ncbi:hypothetical protein [Desulfuromonas thiophila]|nr:hypothetical protein [Desulfuromonas thiophila]
MELTLTEITAYASVALLIGSEVIALNPKWKSNSWVQLAGGVLRRLAGK